MCHPRQDILDTTSVQPWTRIHFPTPNSTISMSTPNNSTPFITNQTRNARTRIQRHRLLERRRFITPAVHFLQFPDLNGAVFSPTPYLRLGSYNCSQKPTGLRFSQRMWPNFKTGWTDWVNRGSNWDTENPGSPSFANEFW